MPRNPTLKLISFVVTVAAALAISGCADMGHMKKSDIPTDQNPAHDMHKTPGT
jgi:type IV pilus biogenesis protein CpaD/CtpE